MNLTYLLLLSKNRYDILSDTIAAHNGLKRYDKKKEDFNASRSRPKHFRRGMSV